VCKPFGERERTLRLCSTFLHEREVTQPTEPGWCSPFRRSFCTPDLRAKGECLNPYSIAATNAESYSGGAGGRRQCVQHNGIRARRKSRHASHISLRNKTTIAFRSDWKRPANLALSRSTSPMAILSNRYSTGTWQVAAQESLQMSASPAMSSTGRKRQLIDG
jgi:hypothetical protein